MPDEVFDKAPDHDVAAQRQPAYPDQDDAASEVATAIGNDAANLLEADPADVADQHRPAPVLADDEPWP